MILRDMIFGAKHRLMPTIKGDEAQRTLSEAIMGGATSYGGTVWGCRD